MGCCGSLIKYLLFIFNFFFVLVGIALIVVGSVLLVDVGDFPEIAENLEVGVQAPQIVIIVIGVIIFLIAFLGCCGAIKENRCMLITFGVLLLVIFITQLAIGIYAVVTFKDTSVENALQKIFDKNDADSKTAFDNLQSSLQCCGVKDMTDYGNSMPPDSCCPGQDCRNSDYYTQGCSDALNNWIESSGIVIGGVALGLCVIEIIGFIFAFVQARHVNDLI